MSTDILEKLHDLHLQATTERSHYYVSGCCLEAIAEITRLRTMRRVSSEWQPIETAPKDGSTYVLLRCHNPAHTCVGVYWPNKWKPIHSDHEVFPTHWMPLPPPPVERGQS